MPRILIPITSFSKSGGMRVLSNLGNTWTKLGLDVTIVSFLESEKPYYPVNFKIIWIDRYGNTVIKNEEKYEMINSALRRIFALYHFIKKNQDDFDVLIANHNLTAWATLFAKTRNHLCVYYIQAYEPGFEKIRSVKSFLKYVIAYLTYFFPFVKIVNADIYKRYKNIKTNYVIPPGLDLSVYYPREIEWTNKYNNTKFVVGCIGREAEWKGSGDVGEAVRILHQNGHNDIHLRVAFNKINYENYEIVFPDGDENLANFYRSLDVLVAPGHIQLGAIHYPVIEAMACKVPVITTGYYPANTENSFIVPVKNPAQIAETILEIKNNSTIAIDKAEKAFKEVQRFDWDIVSSEFMKIIVNEKKGIKRC